MNQIDIEGIRAEYDAWKRWEAAMHGGTGAAIIQDSEAHTAFNEWLIGGFPALLDAHTEQAAEIARLEGLVEDMETFKVHSQAIGKLSSCNDCMLAKDCVVKPGIGEWVRINCHLWRGFSEREGG